MGAEDVDQIRPEGYEAQHFLRFPLPDRSEIISLTGIARARLRGDGGSSTTRLQMAVSLPDIHPGQAFRIHHWTVFCSLQGVTGDSGRDPVGWGVDTFWMTDFSPEPTPLAVFFCDLAVGSGDDCTVRVGYSVMLQGRAQQIGS